MAEQPMRRFLFYRSQWHKLLMLTTWMKQSFEMSKSHGK